MPNIPHYLSDELAFRLMQPPIRPIGLHYVFTGSEAYEQFSALVDDSHPVISHLCSLLQLRANVMFAAVSASKPYQVIHIGADDFAILVAPRAFYYLLTLCLRLQSLRPIAQSLGTPTISCEKNYQGWLLLDIAKNITFHTTDVKFLLDPPPQTRNVYNAALTYILAHEIIHIAHGHLEFIRSKYFHENFKSQLDRDLTMRTLEMDSDSGATTISAGRFEMMAANFIENRTDRSITEEEVKRMNRVRYTTGFLFALIYHDALASGNYSATHPMSYARFLTTSGVLEKYFSLFFPEAVGIPEAARLSVVETFVSLSGTIGFLGHPMASNMMVLGEGTDPVFAYNSFGIAVGLSELQPLHGRWARIYPMLLPFKRGGSLAPPSVAPC